MAHPFFRPLSNFGIWAYWMYLKIPLGPIKRLRKRVLVECHPLFFKDRSEFFRYSREKKILPGAVWDAHWLRHEVSGPDGKSIHVQLPHGLGTWSVDSNACNCTQDDQHHCWVRSGSVEDGTLYIGKQGYTCTGGTGSIVNGRYHARLVHNCLIEIPRPIDRLISFFKRNSH